MPIKPPFSPRTLPEEVKAIRCKRDLSQSGFAREYNITTGFVSRIERGVSLPSLDLWLKIAGYSSLSQDDAVRLWARAHLPEEYRSAIPIG